MQIVQDLLKQFLKKEPFITKVKKIYDFVFDLMVIYPCYKIFAWFVAFRFQQATYCYFLSPYNFTWENERIIEVPIIWRLVNEGEEKKILEVGNVLSHYFRINHDVVDKYEKTGRVINEDITYFQPNHKYDLIVSISTFEHIGFDEDPRDTGKILVAIKNIRNLLALGGRAVITLPLGYHPELDDLLKEEKIQFDEKYCMKRISRLNSWVEVKWDTVRNPTYDKPFRFANWLFVGVINNHSAVENHQRHNSRNLCQ